MPKGTEVLAPNLGLYLDRSKLIIPQRALSDGLNFRIQDMAYNNLNLGWVRFGNFQLNGPVKFINSFTALSQGLPEQLLLGTPTDIYLYKPNTDKVVFLTPRYQTGTASASGTAVTGIGTLWLANVKAGDEIHFGAANYTDPEGVWYTVNNVVNNLSLVLTTTAGTIGATAYTIRRKFTGNSTTEWSTEIFIRTSGGVDEWWATNGLDNIVKWNGSDTQVQDEASGFVMGFRAKVLHIFYNMMMFTNLTQSGQYKPADLINSDVGNPSNVAGGISEQFRVHSGQDEIRAMEQLGDNLVFYSRNHIIIAQFVGDPLIFIFRTVIVGEGTGPISQNAVANYGDYHAYIGQDTQYRFDGVTINDINNHVWREILRTQDPVRITQSYHHFDQETGELLWVVPLTTDTGSGTATSPPAVSYVEHYLEPKAQNGPDPYSKRTFPFTSTGFYSKQTSLTWDQLTQQWNQLNFRWNDHFFFSAFPLNLAGDATGKIWQFSASQNADGAALPSFIRFGRRVVVDGRMRALLTRVYPFVDQFNTPVDITVFMSDHGAGPATSSETQSFDQSLPQGGHFAVFYRRGRFTEVQFATNGVNRPYKVSGYDIDVRKGGKR